LHNSTVENHYKKGINMKIEINKIKKASIFCDDFTQLERNKEIIFGKNSVAIVYGPNGTGKTSLAKILGKEEKTEYNIKIDDQTYTQIDPIFAHIVSDQNDRNIIKGNTKDFILGDNIRREYELRDSINKKFENIFENKLSLELKEKFGVSTKQSQFDGLHTDKELLEFISDIANSKSKGSGIDKNKFIEFISGKNISEILFPEASNFKFFIDDYKDKKSAIKTFLDQIFKLDEDEKLLLKVEQHKEAISILQRFNYLDECIVCDHEIEPYAALERKKVQHERSTQSLGDRAKVIISGILEKLENKNDPFGIAETLRQALLSGSAVGIEKVKSDIIQCIVAYPVMVLNSIISTVGESGVIADWNEYLSLAKDKPKFESEDIVFIERFLNDCLDKKISIMRDDNGNLRLLLGDDEFLNRDRDELLLSNGEQNFLSLAFELLKAQKSPQKLIVLDDPISSFDSIYKNKIAFAILKLLSAKKVIVLTHSTDLIKLLEHQKQGCFNLYYLNNTSGEENGFISVNENETGIFLYIPKLLELLRGPIKSEIKDELSFLVSITPFLRGCTQIFNLPIEKELLTKVMHGYQDEKVNLSQIYRKVIGEGVIDHDHEVSARDIINLNCDNPIAIKGENYPLLQRTLTHTFTYLFLRLNTERKLVSKFAINTTKYDMLSNIITFAFNGDDEASIANRVFFLSRKTLLNEFNHFEMDMNIFQPAIDITNQSLAKEKDQILKKLAEL
jgi:ABC-type lipoprotein export system ATPase subunit